MQIVNYLEECQFKICWHRRDFEPGTQVSENIEDAIVHSRRMIFVISRYKYLSQLQKPCQIWWILQYHILFHLCHLYC